MTHGVGRDAVLQEPAVAEPREPHNRPAPAGASATARRGALASLDAWMAEHPWHPRVTPFAVYVALLIPIGFARDAAPATYPFLYVLQCALVAWLLWRYRRLLPELTLSFHPLAVPVGVLVAVAWVWLGMAVAEWDRVQAAGLWGFTRDLALWVAAPASVSPGFVDQEARSFFGEIGPRLGWLAMALRLAGMALLVPLFEELFIRSAMLRSLHSGRRTAIGAAQILDDIPVIGEALEKTALGRQAAAEPPVFAREFHRVPLGALSLFGVTASTIIFALSHAPRDWPGAVFCGVAYCLLLAATNLRGRGRGLGPVIWAHGITNALLWGYTLWTGDWRFL